MTGGDNQRPSREQIGWLAGMIDGEGWVGLYSVNRGTHQQYKPSIQVVGTNEQGLEELDCILNMLQVGHHIYRRNGSKQHGGWGTRQSWVIQMNGAKRISTLLENVLDRLVIKRPQAELLRDWVNIRLAQPIHSAYTMREVEIVRLIREANSRRLNDYTPDIVARQVGAPSVGPLDEQQVTELKEAGIAIPDNLRTCPMCAARFIPKRSDQEYCSARCRNRSAMRRSRANKKI